MQDKSVLEQLSVIWYLVPAFHRNEYPELHELLQVLLAYVLTVMTTKTVVFCELTKCTLAEGSLLHNKNRGNTLLQNVFKFLPHYRITLNKTVSFINQST